MKMKLQGIRRLSLIFGFAWSLESFAAPPIVLSPAVNPRIFPGEQTTLIPTGGTPPFNYLIYDGGAAGTLSGSTVTATNGGRIYILVTDSASQSALTVIPVRPSPPSGLSANPGSGKITLNWNAAISALSYNVYRGTSSGNETALATGIASPSFTDLNVTYGVTYYYVVKTKNQDGYSTNSLEISSTPLPPAPTTPTNFKAIPGDSGVALSWNSVNSASSYTLKRSTASGQEQDYQTGISGTSYTDTGVVNNVTYFYKLVAVNGGGVSPPTTELSATPQAAPPASPSGVVATPGVGKITLSWNTASGALSYTVYRGTSSGSESLYADGVAATTFIDNNAISGTTYYYYVRAVNSGGAGPNSAEVSAKAN